MVVCEFKSHRGNCLCSIMDSMRHSEGRGSDSNSDRDAVNYIEDFMEWLFLAMAALVYVAGCWLTYNNDLKPYWWYVPLGVFLGGIINAIWFWAAKMYVDKDRM